MSEGRNKGWDNLIRFDEMTPEKQKELARQGGIRSGEAKREKKLLKEYLEIALSMQDNDGEDRYTKITRALVDKAEDGDTKAFEVVRDTLGQKPKEEVEQKQEIKVVMDDSIKEWGK